MDTSVQIYSSDRDGRAQTIVVVLQQESQPIQMICAPYLIRSLALFFRQ
jgi:hypothetical protein